MPLAAHNAQPFGARPKMHMADHLAHEKIQIFGSPKHFWCYGDEDFVGLVKRIAVMTRHPKTMEARILAKYSLLAALLSCSSGIVQ